MYSNAKAGEALDPSRESLRTLLSLKQTIGEYNFASQYQQNPIPIGGALVKTEWLRYYDVDDPLPNFLFILQSWDTASKSGDLKIPAYARPGESPERSSSTSSMWSGSG